MNLAKHWLENTPPEEVLKNPYFFCENGKEFSWREAAEQIGKALFEAGKIRSPEPKTIPKDLYRDLFVSASACQGLGGTKC